MSNYNFKDNLTVDNNRFLKWFDSSNTRQNIIGLDTSNDLSINNGGGTVSLNPSGTSNTFINSGNSGVTVVDNKLGVGFTTTTNMNSELTLVKDSYLSTNTVLASNDGFLGFTGSSELSHSAGSSIISYGQDHSTLPGHLQYYTGSSGEHSFYTAADIKRAQILSDGTSNFMPNGSTIRLSITDSLSTFGNAVHISDTTEADNASTGALTVAGGLGVLGNTVIDGTLSINSIIGNLEFNSTRPSLSYSSGSITVEGGFGIQHTQGAASVTSGGGLSVAGGFALGKNAIIGGDVTLLSSTVSTNSQTGSLVTYGGVGLNKTVHMKAVAPHMNFSPLVSGNEVSMHFYSLDNFTETTGTSGGWHLGPNALSVGSGNFTIGHITNPRMTFHADGRSILSTDTGTQVFTAGDGLAITTVNGTLFAANTDITFSNRQFSVFNGSTTDNTFVSQSFESSAGGTADVKFVGNSTTTSRKLVTTIDNVDIINLDYDGLIVYPTTSIVDSINITSAEGGALNVSGDITIDGIFHFAQGGFGDPTFTTRSSGTKIVLYPEVNGSKVDYAFGVSSNVLWSSVPIASGVFKWFGGTTELMTLTSTNLSSQAPVIIDSTNTEAFLVRKDADGGDVFTVDTTNTSVKLGPGVGIQNSLVSLYGSQSSAILGPNILCTTTQDVYPLLQIYNDLHDNISLNFDMYWSGSAWTSSDFGSNFQIHKIGDSLNFNYSTGVSAGSVITTATGLSINNVGDVSIKKGLIIDSTYTEALLVRKNSDGGDVFTVDTTNSVVTVSGNITVTGTVDSRDIATDGTTLDTLNTTIGLGALTTVEVDQLENINSVTISNTQWGYLGATDQALATTDNVQFNSVIVDSTGTEAFLIRQNSDAGDVFTVDTTNLNVRIDGNLIIDATDTSPFIIRKNSGGTNVFVVDTVADSVTCGASQIIEITKPEAFIVRKDSDTGDVFIVNTTDEIVCVLGTVDATSTTTGAFKVSGGVGIEGSLYVGGTLHSDALFELEAITLDSTTPSTNLSTGSLVTLGGITINNTSDVTSLTNGGSLTSAGGVAIAKSVQIGGTIDAIGTTNVFGAMQLLNNDSGISYLTAAASRSTGEYQSLYITGYDKTPIVAEFNATTTSSSLSTGTLVVHNGGIGINFTDNAVSITSGGTLTSGGGASFAKQLFIGSNTQIGDNTVAPQQALTVGTEGYGANKDHGIRVSVNDASSTSHVNYRYVDLRLLSNGSSSYRGALLGTLAGGVSSEHEFISLNQTGTMDFYGVSTFRDTSDATSSVTGSVIVNGGLGVVKDIFVDGGITIDSTGTEAFLVRKDGDSGDIFVVDTTNTCINIGPGVPLADTTMLSLYGTTTSAADGPHITVTTTEDAYPLYQQLNFSHDNIWMSFDAYFDGAWKSSDVGSNFSINKNIDNLIIKYASGNSQGSAVTWANAIQINSSGVLQTNDLIIDVTSTEALLVRKDVDGGDILAVDSTNTSIKFGPGTGIQNSLVSLYGTHFNVLNGPHIMCTTTEDTYPVFQQLNWGHDNLRLSFDAYYDGAWKSSDIGSNFSILKGGDQLVFEYDSGNAQGGGVTWSTAISIDTSGQVSLNQPTNILSTTSITNTVNSTTAVGGALNISGDTVVAPSKQLHFAQGGLGLPTFTTRSAGTKLVLYPELAGSSGDYAIGINSGELWNSVPTTSASFTWYGGTSLSMVLEGNGKMTLYGQETIDTTNTEAFLVRKDGDSQDVFTIDSTNQRVVLANGTTTGALAEKGLTLRTDNTNTFTANTDVGNSNRSFVIRNDDSTTNNYVQLGMRVGDGTNDIICDQILVKDTTESGKLVYTLTEINTAGNTSLDLVELNSTGEVLVNGKVIIDTTSTEALLVRKSGDTGDIFFVDTQNVKVHLGDSDLYGQIQGGNPLINFESGDFLQYDRTASQYNFNIASTSYMELNTTGLTLTSTVDATSNTEGGALTVSGGGAVLKDFYVGGTIVNSSDIRLKTNITDLPSVLDKLDNIRTVTYQHNPETAPHQNPDETLYGLLAQEVQQEFPYLVKGQGHLALDYSRFTVILLNAVKELNEKVKDLEKRL